MNARKVDFDQLKRNWPYPYVVRSQTQLNKFSGGILLEYNMKSLDIKGKGPKGKITINGNEKVAYTLDGLIEWMKENIKDLD
ncbi:MAG: hypothetical protein BWY74_02416 [Firmicutes bacterium ADurb.Bin419]|nr:MAG: hypothetical protein BWY74_02416 [Firmicutes bacterium ADurb.Bin419]